MPDSCSSGHDEANVPTGASEGAPSSVIYPISLAKELKADSGKQWEPSNGTEGYAFIESWCGECQRDKSMREGVDLDECDDNEKCEIIAASFRGEAKEWQYDKSGQPCCIAFVPKGEAIPVPRCPHTMELPLENAQILEFPKG